MDQETAAQESSTGAKRRGRPPRSAGAGLSRERIIEKALDIAGADGFRELTMHRLAEELGVTPRALYNHVSDRQDVVDGAALLLIHNTPVPDLDPHSWENSLRVAYRAARNYYRKIPRAMLISLDETVTTAGVGDERIDLSETKLRFYTEIGLTLQQAIVVNGAFLVDVFGFALLIDYRYDRSDDRAREQISKPVPEEWLDNRDAPLARAAAELPPVSNDQIFESFIDLRIAGIRAMLDAT